MQFLEDAPLAGRRVLLRINGNVPLGGKKAKLVADDYRLRQVLPTIHYLLDYQAKVILLAHLGRPEGKIDHQLSLRPVYLHLSALLKKPIQFAPTLFSEATRRAVEGLGDGEILALENLRFDPGEQKNSRTFAAKLAKYGDIYVNDAFSDSHNAAASVEAIADLLPSYGGLLLEREVQILSGLMKHPSRPYVAVVGGAKIANKLPTIRQLIRHADRVLVGGGVANTFLQAAGQDIKQSLCDSEYLDAAKEILKLGKGKLVLPTDFVWRKNAIVDLGSETQAHYAKILKGAETVFWTGPLGLVEEEKYQAASLNVARAMIDSGATTVVGGGDTVGFVNQAKLAKQFAFVSTGGSATLEYLSGQTLPGLKALG